ncbi:DNA polymerase III subunit gamma/tau [Metamycoplasma alkalescens]|uniref:DNA polymerase III subunit gamma/tau n=1 Tax=Metamycoplasma alkalescens TaxID=45363 RepID=UPI003D058704
MTFEKKYLALYRQYRPKTFDDVYGQKHIIESLKNIIRENKLTHAYLFCGPHGNGKTSTAKIFANAINCEHRFNENPCDLCIKNINQNIDIIEIDAASNTGIDDIRELKEKIKHLPTHGKYKIYIIDEVHMLSKSAFNALLKTIEEPPKHVIFILATTDPQKIPLTILSRVQRFNFKKIDKDILFEQITTIFNKENINAELEAIKLIVDLGNGSFRDTLSIADQVAVYCSNGIITKQAIEELYGIVYIQNILFLIKAILTNNHTQLINKYNYLVENGASVEKLISQIFNVLKDYFVLKKTHDEKLLEFCSKKDLVELKIDDERLFYYFELMQKAIKEIQSSNLPKQIIELYLLKMASYELKENLVSTDFLLNKHLTENNNFEPVFKNNQDNNDLQINNSAKEFNSVFDLASIANSYDLAFDQEKNKEIITNDIKKNQDQLDEIKQNIEEDKEKNASFAKKASINDLLDDLLSPNEQKQKNDNNEQLSLKPELDQEEVNTLAFIYQYMKMNLYGWNGNKIQANLDVMHYNMLKNRLGKKYEHLNDLFFGFKVFLCSNELIVLKSDDIFKVHQLNLRRNADEFIEASNSIFARYLNVVAVTQDQVTNAIEYCKNNWKTKNPEEIKMISLLNLDKYKNKVSETVEYAKKLFGDIVKEPSK